MRGAIPPLPKYTFMASCLVKHRDYLYCFLERRDTFGHVSRYKPRWLC